MNLNDVIPVNKTMEIRMRWMLVSSRQVKRYRIKVPCFSSRNYPGIILDGLRRDINSDPKLLTNQVYCNGLLSQREPIASPKYKPLFFVQVYIFVNGSEEAGGWRRDIKH